MREPNTVGTFLCWAQNKDFAIANIVWGAHTLDFFGGALVPFGPFDPLTQVPNLLFFVTPLCTHVFVQHKRPSLSPHESLLTLHSCHFTARFLTLVGPVNRVVGLAQQPAWRVQQPALSVQPALRWGSINVVS